MLGSSKNDEAHTHTHTHTHTKLLMNNSGDLIFVVRVDKNYCKLWKNGSSEKLNEVKEI